MKSDTTDLQCFAGIPNGTDASLFRSEYTSHFKGVGAVWVRENVHIKKRYIPVFPRHKHPSVLLSVFQTSGFRSSDSNADIVGGDVLWRVEEQQK